MVTPQQRPEGSGLLMPLLWVSRCRHTAREARLRPSEIVTFILWLRIRRLKEVESCSRTLSKQEAEQDLNRRQSRI